MFLPVEATLPDRGPVMMWMHGGGMLTGSATNPGYDGSNLAREGALVVTVGYRLGVLGFLALPELSAESEHHVSGNYARELRGKRTTARCSR